MRIGPRFGAQLVIDPNIKSQPLKQRLDISKSSLERNLGPLGSPQDVVTVSQTGPKADNVTATITRTLPLQWKGGDPGAYVRQLDDQATRILKA